MISLRNALAALAAAVGALTLAPLAFAGSSSQPAPLAPEDQALVAKAGAYLDGLVAAQGRFVQTDAHGASVEGSYYMKRPGRIRFEYDPPATLLVVSDGHNVTVYDQRLRTFNAYPLGFTPLHLFLARNVRLDKGVAIDRVEHTSGGFSLTAHSAAHPREGSITMEFADDPVRLAAWTVTDSRGARTHVALTSLKPVPDLSSQLFTITVPPRSTAR
jgi:outer membrane lipoprotein-sorting protein